MAEIWKGAPVAKALTEELTVRAEKLKTLGINPCLAILRIGENPSDLSYETGVLKRCDKIGIAVRQFIIKEDYEEEELFAAVKEINEDPNIHGCLFFRPLKNKAHEQWICDNLKPEKDLDCATAGSLATVFAGSGSGYGPCTAEAVLEILKHYGCNISGLRACIIGRSLVIGRPVAMMLLKENATVTLCHTKTQNPAEISRECDILVAAAGKAKIIGPEYLSENTVVIDVGINEDEEGKLCGDVDFEKASAKCRAITPVPGGVGAVTTAILAKHLITAAEKAQDKAK